VQEWLRRAAIDENDENTPASAPARHRREDNRRSMHRSSYPRIPSLSPVDSSSSSPSISVAATTPRAMPLKSHDNTKANRLEGKAPSPGLSVEFSFDGESIRNVQGHHAIIANERQEEYDFQKIMSGSDFLHPSYARLSSDRPHEFATNPTVTANEYGMQSMNSMICEPRNFADPPMLNTNGSKYQGKIGNQTEVKAAIDRALFFAKATNTDNHQSRKATKEPSFPFRKLLSSSRTGRQLIDVCFRVTLKETSDESRARKKRQRWSKALAFLVAIVHDNQEETASGRTSTNDRNEYDALDYSPPVKERQLEDYASACAAVQSVVHALDEDGFASEVNSTIALDRCMQ